MNETSQAIEQPAESLDTILHQLYEDASAEEEAQSAVTGVVARPQSPQLAAYMPVDGARSMDSASFNGGNASLRAMQITQNSESPSATTERFAHSSNVSSITPARGHSEETRSGRRGAGVQEQREYLGMLHERLAEINESLTRTGSETQARDLLRHGRRISEVTASIASQANGLRSLEGQLRDLDRRLNQINRSMNSAARDRRRDFNRRMEELQRNSPVLTASSISPRLDEARQRLAEARTAREDAATELEASESEVQACREEVRQLQREQRTIENYTRLFGTREEMERQGADYESPIGRMFNRAWERYRSAEEVRRDERTLREVLEGEDRVVDNAEARWYTQIPDPDMEQITIANILDHQAGDEADGVPELGLLDESGNHLTSLRDWRRGMDPAPASGPSRREMLVAGIESLISTDSGAAAAEAPTPRSHPPLGTRAGSNVSAWRPDIDLLNARQRHLLEVARQADPRLRTVLPAGTTNPPLPPATASVSTITAASAPVAVAIPANLAANFNRVGDVVDAAVARIPNRFPFGSTGSVNRPFGRGPPVSLDIPNSSRPPPLEDHHLMVKMECKVCYSQLADTAVLPCGHCVMCRWCAEVAVPVMEGDESGTRLRGAGVNCPVCRAKVRRRVRIML